MQAGGTGRQAVTRWAATARGRQVKTTGCSSEARRRVAAAGCGSVGAACLVVRGASHHVERRRHELDLHPQVTPFIMLWRRGRGAR